MENKHFLVGESLNEVEDFYEDEFGSIIHLKEEIDLTKLQNEGVEFEIDEDTRSPEDLGEFNKEEMYKQCTTDALGVHDDDDEDGKPESDATPFEELAETMVNLQEDGGVKKKLLKQGTGVDIPGGAKVTVQYNAYVEYSDEPVDSTYLRNRPYTFSLSTGGIYDVILGLDTAVKSMKKNEVSKFLITYPYAYGKLGVAPRIPTKATLLFQVELLSFTDCEGGNRDWYKMPESEKRECDFRIRLKAALREKEYGKEQFEQKRYFQAMRKYSQSLKILELARLADEKDEEQQRKQLLKIYINMAVCYLKLGQSTKVISMCNQAQQIDKKNVKIFYLRGKALRQLGEFDRAKENLLKAMSIEPANAETAKELNLLEKRAKQSKFDEIKFCRKMFGTTTVSTNTPVNSSQNGATVTEITDATDEQLPSTQEIAEQFQNIVKEKLQIFIEDDGLLELPFKKSASFTDRELACITAMAEKMHLNVIECGEGNNFHIKIQKNKDKIKPEAQ